MSSYRLKNALLTLFALVGVFSASGATCQRQMLVNPFVASGPVAPQILPEGATREQIIAAVNQNSSRVRSITATGATISVPDTFGLPLLSGNIAAERPGRFRLTAGTAVTGQEIDLGSNDDLFWLWARRNQPPTTYFCRHAQFANSNIRQMMPVEPAWLLAAVGIVDLEPANVFDGPLPHNDGTVELRSWLPSSNGTLQRVVKIDARRAWVVGQYVYDPTGRTLLASAEAESHRYYPLEQVSLPELVSIQLPPANMALKINLGVVQINQLTADQSQLWAMPNNGGPQVDLGGAVLGTPLPGGVPNPNQPLFHSGSPVTVPGSGSQNVSTTPVSSAMGAPLTPTDAFETGPLPRYGQRGPTAQPAGRRF